jgi:hypothetical protein
MSNMLSDDNRQQGLTVDTHQTTPQIMSTPPTPTRIRREDRDTGFPEPFGDNFNTTLPHPDADLSPNATISQDDLSVAQAMKRRRLSMLTKHRRTVSQASSVGGATVHGVLSIVSAYIPASPVDGPGGGGDNTGPASDSSGASKMSDTYMRSSGGDGDTTTSPPLSPSSQHEGGEGRRGSAGRLRRWISTRR